MKLYHGSCHCQEVKFEVELDLTQGIHKCNCTYCYKTKYLKVFSKADKLKLLTDPNRLRDYKATPSSWPEGHIHHYFCNRCGVQLFSKAYLELDMEPFNGWFYAVNLATIDDTTPEEIIQAPIIFEDGLHDRQLETPTETRHL